MKNFRRNDRSGGNRGNRSFNSGRLGGMHQAVCSECGQPCQVPFKPSRGKPVYCDNCFSGKRGEDRRPDRKEFGGKGRDFSQPSMYQVICDQCGKPCQVPFKPSGDKPVYCSDCFSSKKDQGRDRARQDDHSNDKVQQALKGINVKLDKILQALAPDRDGWSAAVKEIAEVTVPDNETMGAGKAESKKKSKAEKVSVKKPAGRKRKK